MKKDAIMHFRLPEQLKKQARRYAKDNQMTLSAVITIALKKFLEEDN